MTSIVDEIAADTLLRVEKARKEVPMRDLMQKARRMGTDTGFPFEKALRNGKGISFICEVKKASPSKGLIAPDFPYLSIAEEYQAGGANAISVLTEPRWFLGSTQYLKEIAHAVKIPCLRKDFVVDEYMIYEAKALGASAVLLISSILTDDQLSYYIRTADNLGLSALVEAHDAMDIERSVSAGARIIGVNNRNLADFSVDPRNSAVLRSLVPDDVIFVGESGVRTPEDVKVMEEAGADAVLVGETLMRARDKAGMLAHLRGAC